MTINMKILTQEGELVFYWLLKSGLDNSTSWLNFLDFYKKTGLTSFEVVGLLDEYQKAGAIQIFDFHISKLFYLISYNRLKGGKDKGFEVASKTTELFKYLSAEQIETLNKTECLYIPFDRAWLDEVFWGVDYGFSEGMRFKIKVVDLTSFAKQMSMFFNRYKEDLVDSSDIKETHYFSYEKQKWDVSIFLKQLVKAGHKKTALSISAWDIKPEDVTDQINFSHQYNLVPTLFTMESEGLLSIQNIVFPDKDGGLSNGVEVVVKIEPEWNSWFQQEKNNKANTIELNYQEFRFAEGVLFRDGVSAVLIFREKTLERDIMETAFTKEIDERIDLDLFDTEITSDKKRKAFFDTARRINEKISKKFGLKQRDFFVVNHSENALYRAIK